MKSYFRIPKGLEIDYKIQILTGDGIPGLTGDSTTAFVGSIYSDHNVATPKVYKKHSAGAGADKWVELVDKTYVDSLVNGISWREPVKVMDTNTYVDITAAETAANIGDTVDGVTILAGDRILFTDLTTGGDNVYIVSGSTGAWTFTEDANLSTDGDALLIQEGTSAEDQYSYDGSIWLRIGGSLNNLELSYIRDFVGKTAAGIESPTYTEQNFINSGDNLEAAIDKLDIAIGAAVTDGGQILTTNSINQNIQALDNEITEQGLETITAGVTTQVPVDSIAVTAHDVVKWMVRAYDAVNARWYAAEIFAMHDGAGNVDLTIYAQLKLGSGSIQGLDFDADVLTGNLRLLVSSTDSVTISSKRIAIL